MRWEHRKARNVLFWANWRMSRVLKDEKKQAQTTSGLGKEKGYLTVGGQEELDRNEKIMCLLTLTKLLFISNLHG